jgi:hypothetical protein
MFDGRKDITNEETPYLEVSYSEVRLERFEILRPNIKVH